ncbi:MAG: rod shape-determining protein, partial [Oscillospiraceae bacterium]|nr:rod shape-determining protein [Oscillospiraceae bacterium]
MNVFERDIAVDMGTSSTLLFEQGKGVVAREPTVVAVDKFTGKILKIGQDAQKMLGRTPANIVAIHPVSAGVISDYEITAQMLRELVSRITSFSLFKPCVLACVPSSITGVEERAMIDAAIEAGARKVYLLETAVATAMGAGIDISKADGHMVIDIGGGTTEIAIVSVGGVVECESIKTAGTSFDEAIVKFIRRKYDLLIGLSTAEELKRSIGCVIQRPDIGYEEIKGRDLTNGLPKSIRVSSTELIEAFVEPMNKILESIHAVLERTPPQLVGDLDKNGIIMSGGGSLIYGIDRLI